jgi:hypothetical protein
MLPVFILAHMNDADLLRKVLSHMSNEDLAKAKKAANGHPVRDEELLQVALSYLYDHDLHKARKLSGKSPYILSRLLWPLEVRVGTGGRHGRGGRASAREGGYELSPLPITLAGDNSSSPPSVVNNQKDLSCKK